MATTLMRRLGRHGGARSPLTGCDAIAIALACPPCIAPTRAVAAKDIASLLRTLVKASGWRIGSTPETG